MILKITITCVYKIYKPKTQSKNNNPPIIISVDGYSYTLNKQYKNKNKYFRCRKFKTEKCGGSIILSPNETVVRKQFHTCSGMCKV